MHNSHYLYFKAFRNSLKEYHEDAGETDKRMISYKVIFYGVKAVNTLPEEESITRKDAELNFQISSIVKNLVGTLTPKEFMQMFPIQKEFKGHKWQMKDYFYTKEYIQTLEANKPIRESEDPLMFLWEYTNWDITMFNLKLMRHMSDLRELDGHQSLAMEWAEMNGLKTYTSHTDPKGKEYLLDREKGKTIKVKKKYPRHLKLVQS